MNKELYKVAASKLNRITLLNTAKFNFEDGMTFGGTNTKLDFQYLEGQFSIAEELASISKKFDMAIKQAEDEFEAL